MSEFVQDLVQLKYGRVIPVTRANKVLRYIQFFQYLNEQKNRPDVDVAKIRFISLIAYALTYVHICGCAWFSFGYVEGFGSNAWLPSEALWRHHSSFHQYLVSVFWVLGVIAGQSETHPPETFPEEIFTAFVILLGTFMFAYIVGRYSCTIESSPYLIIVFD